MIAPRRRLACALCAAAALALAASAPEGLQQFDNRREGTLSSNNNNPEFTIRGIHRRFDSFGRNATLTVRFAAPDANAKVFLTASELLVRKHYWMEATKFSGGTWRRFGPWETAAILDGLGVAWDNIGVLAGYSGDAGPVYCPVEVGQSWSGGADTYRVHFRLGVSLQKLETTVTTETGGPTRVKVPERQCNTKLLPGCTLWDESTLQFVDVDMSSAATGRYQVKLDGTLSGAKEQHALLTFTLYHRKFTEP